MLDDFRIEAAWKYSMYNITQKEALFLPFSPPSSPSASLLSLRASSCMSASFHPSSCLYLDFFVR